ncbi:plasminogen activator inhibitor 1-like [Maniola hyperantus]|uniref:plasminogen activator inhibitor 1-like n=1 Tax=Aphantopus hyperantus TaxID=2795564 RepID=UPI00156883BD|nr:plasminogen activator inhibitor 1-like [Maniola hyperantus]
MRVIIFLIFFISASFGDLDFNSKTRNFSVELFYHTLQGSDRDVAISPYTVWSLLISLAYETTGRTWEQFSKVFLLTEDRSKIVEEFRKQRTSVVVNRAMNVSLTNFLFYDEQLNVHSDGIRRLENDFNFIATRLNFEAPQRAADSAFEFMRSHHEVASNILRLKEEDFLNATMVMSNCLSFIAAWSKPFNVSNSSRDYYRDGNARGSEMMMYVKAQLQFWKSESLHASFTQLPLGDDGRYCMLLVRPDSGHDVGRVLERLREVSLLDILNKMQEVAVSLGLGEVEVKLPRLAINSRLILNTPLSNMGLSDVFDQNFADFNNFAEDKIYVGDIAQTVSVYIREYGTIVSTTTPASPAFIPLEGRTPIKQVPVREPFIFFIMEKSTATVLFGGSYSKINVY